MLCLGRTECRLASWTGTQFFSACRPKASQIYASCPHSNAAGICPGVCKDKLQETDCGESPTFYPIKRTCAKHEALALVHQSF